MTNTVKNIAAVVAPSFDELSHAAVNIVLEAENTAKLDREIISPLVVTLIRKIRRGETLDMAKLAGSSAVKNLVRAAIAEARKDGFSDAITTDDRSAAALHLAACIIDRATEDAEQ